MLQLRSPCHRLIRAQVRPIQHRNHPSLFRVHSLQHPIHDTRCLHRVSTHRHDTIWNRKLSMEPTYWQSIRIGWTILWRGVGSVVLLLTLVNALIIMSLPELARTSPSWGAFLFPFVLTAVFGAFGIMPWLVRHLCTTSYPGFRLQLVQDAYSSTLDRRAMDQHPP